MNGQSNLTQSTWTVQLYSPRGASVQCTRPIYMLPRGLPDSESTTLTASQSIQPFMHSSRQCRWACLGMSILLKIAPRHGEAIWTPSNTWFRGPTRVLDASGIAIGSAVLAGLTTVTD